jgi:acyl-coenzyme A synthetase/AMP-(fatty) acid ligase
MTTLLDFLEEHPGNTQLLSFAGETFNAAFLVEWASRFRSQQPQLAGRRIALQESNPLSLIQHLIALDGYAHAIFLIPFGLGEGERERLLGEAAIDYVISDKGIDLLDPATVAERGIVDQSEWLLATSGTTGTPKILVHTLVGLAQKANRNKEKGRNFVWGLLYDPNRFAGLQVVLQALIGGSCLALATGGEIEQRLGQMAKAGINALSATPSLWRKLLMGQAIKGCTLRQITLGGEIVDQTILDALRSHFPEARITHIYASTEAGVGFAVNDGRAGFPRPFLDEGVGGGLLRVDAEGYLYIKPADVSQHFLDSSRQLLEEDGYINTQDLVRIVDDRVFFLGRANGSINVGGNKVHPEEVETLIHELDGVEEVMVFGKSSSIMGQLVAAKVVAGEGVDTKQLRGEIARHCRKQLESYKIPTMIQFVANLQANEAGKIVRDKA